MKHYFKSILIILSGLLVFQVFSTLQVFLSNSELLQILIALENSSYFPVPNSNIIPSLQSPGVAFAGGVFFTLTVGTYTVLAAMGGAILWLRFDRYRPVVLMLFSLYILLVLAFINQKGLLFSETIAFVSTSVSVFLLCRLFFGEEFPVITPASVFVHVLMLIVLNLILIGAMRFSSESIFVDFRDRFLMTNTIGKSINDYYYKYTMYPANVFKPVSNRFPRVCSLISEKGKGDTSQIRNRLIQYDYLVLDPPESENDFLADFIIEKIESDLLLKYKGKIIVTTKPIPFIKDSGEYLSRFSEETDRYYNYRQLTALGLKTGLPLFFYILIHFTLFTLVALILKRTELKDQVGAFTSILGLILCVTAFGILAETESIEVKRDNLKSLLSSSERRDRIAALRFIDRNKINMVSLPDFELIGQGGDLTETYRYARALGHSRTAGAEKKLIGLLDDTRLNVVCQALYGLGIRGNRRMIPTIMDRIRNTDEWYIQWYGYRALKRLGWTQKSK